MKIFKNKFNIIIFSFIIFSSKADNMADSLTTYSEFYVTSKVSKIMDDENLIKPVDKMSFLKKTNLKSKKLNLVEKIVIKKLSKKITKLAEDEIYYSFTGVFLAIIGLILSLIGLLIGSSSLSIIGLIVFLFGIYLFLYYIKDLGFCQK